MKRILQKNVLNPFWHDGDDVHAKFQFLCLLYVPEIQKPPTHPEIGIG